MMVFCAEIKFKIQLSTCIFIIIGHLAWDFINSLNLFVPLHYRFLKLKLWSVAVSLINSKKSYLTAFIKQKKLHHEDYVFKYFMVIHPIHVCLACLFRPQKVENKSCYPVWDTLFHFPSTLCFSSGTIQITV